MKQISWVLFSLLIIVFSCSEKIKSTYLNIELDELENKNDKLFNLAEEIHLISLESEGFESLVGLILKTDFHKGKFIILSSNSSNKKTVHIFSDSGKHIKSYDKVETSYSEPQAIEDYVLIDDKLAILCSNNSLFMLDEDQNIFLEKKIDFKSDVFVSSNKLILSYTNQKALDFQSDSLLYELLLFDTDFKIINKFKKFNPAVGEARNHIRLSSNIQKIQNGFLFTEYLNDTVYHITNENKLPKYIVIFGAKKFDRNKNPEFTPQPFSPILTENHYWGVTNPILNEEIFLFEFYKGNIPHGVYFNQNTQMGKLFNPMNLLRDENVVPWPKFFDGEFYYGILTESDLNYLDKNSITTYSKDSIIKKIYNLINKNSNPVIVKYKLKKL